MRNAVVAGTLPVRIERRAGAGSELCRRCRHGAVCGFRRAAPEPVTACEEFDAIGPAFRIPLRAAAPHWGSPADGGAPEQDFEGLCHDCEARFSCTLPRPAGGVWHCTHHR